MGLSTFVTLDGKPLLVEVSRAAVVALERRTTPLLAEMELYFSCLVRKRVNFRDGGGACTLPDPVGNLAVRFRPIMTRSCSVSAATENGAPPVTDFPVANTTAFLPRWLRIDYRGNRWHGEFGYLGGDPVAGPGTGAR